MLYEAAGTTGCAMRPGDLGMPETSLEQINPAELQALGNDHLAACRYPQALQCYLELSKVTPDSWDVAFRCAVLFHELKQYDDALSYLDRCDALQPRADKTSYMRSRALRDLKNYDGALLASQQAEA